MAVAKNNSHLRISRKWLLLWWAHLGSNQGPTDYESATLTN